MRTSYPQKKLTWLSRLAAIQARVQQALTLGVRDPDIDRLTEELTGGLHCGSGLIPSTEQQIALGIQNIEPFGLRDLPHRGIWIMWPSRPTRVRDNFAGVERAYLQLESIVRDGGRLEQRLNDKAAQRGVSPRVPESVRPAPGPKVKTTFEL